MAIPIFRPLLSLVCFSAVAGLLSAAEKTTDVTPPKAVAKPVASPAPEPVMVLPKVEITASRIKKIDKEIKRLDKLIYRESEKVKSTDLDRTLNNSKLSSAAALFGGNSSEHLSAVAATRVALLENERDVLEAMKRPATLDELAMMEKEVEQLRLSRRNLDDAAKQR